MMGGTMAGSGWMLGFGWLFMVLFWVLIILGAVALTRSVFPTGDSTKSGDRRPLELLKERYARGGISREQYEQMRRDLAV